MSTPRYQGETKRDFFIRFLNILQSEEYRAHITVKKYSVLHFLQWIPELSSDDAKELVSVMQCKASRGK